MARPLYHGWGHAGALEDVWSFIASAVSTEDSLACSHRQAVDVIECPDRSCTGLILCVWKILGRMSKGCCLRIHTCLLIGARTFLDRSIRIEASRLAYAQVIVIVYPRSLLL